MERQGSRYPGRNQNEGTWPDVRGVQGRAAPAAASGYYLESSVKLSITSIWE